MDELMNKVEFNQKQQLIKNLDMKKEILGILDSKFLNQ